MPHEPTVHIVDDGASVRDSLRWLTESVDLSIKTYDSAQAFLKDGDDAAPAVFCSMSGCGTSEDRGGSSRAGHGEDASPQPRGIDSSNNSGR